MPIRVYTSYYFKCFHWNWVRCYVLECGVLKSLLKLESGTSFKTWNTKAPEVSSLQLCMILWLSTCQVGSLGDNWFLGDNVLWDIDINMDTSKPCFVPDFVPETLDTQRSQGEALETRTASVDRDDPGEVFLQVVRLLPGQCLPPGAGGNSAPINYPPYILWQATHSWRVGQTSLSLRNPASPTFSCVPIKVNLSLLGTLTALVTCLAGALFGPGDVI